MSKMEKEVKEKVDGLLSLVCNEMTDAKTRKFVSEKLTSMAILGTLPPSCIARRAGKKCGSRRDLDLDHSESKERWIAR